MERRSSDRQQGTGPSKLSAALQEAETIVEAAKKRAQELLSDAESEARRLIEQGYRDGFQKGSNEAATNAVRLLEESSQLDERLSAEAARLAFAICERVIGEHLKVEPDTVKRIAKEALQESVLGQQATVLVHPEDLPILKSAIGELRRVTGGAEIAIEGDNKMHRGGCIVRTPFGEVDASVESLVGTLSTKLGLRRD